MLISAYNAEVLGDVLIVVTGVDNGQQKEVKKADIVQITNESGQIIGYNFFNIAKKLQLDMDFRGQVFLNEVQVGLLNELLKQAGFNDSLKPDLSPKFVVGYVKEISDHPNSNHLHVCQIEFDHKLEEQIVCGAPNVAQEQKVVVAKVGAMMPNGQIIFPGKLRGVVSNGMLCSARELGLNHAPQKPGILILPSDYQVGTAIELKDLNKIMN